MMWNCVVAAALICAPLAVRTCASPDARECDPQRVWDLMIRAKGGRDRFEQVKTFYYSRTQSFGFLRRLRLRQDTLFIVPEFRWSWNQPASSVFRTTVNVIRGKQLIRAEPQRVEYLNAEVWVPYPFINVALYMPGLPVWKPILKGCRVGVGGQTTLVAKLQGGKFIYEFAEDNYLPTKVSVTLGRVTDTHVFTDYANVDGFMLPATHRETLSKLSDVRLRMRYEINPEYDPAIMFAEPSVEAGPDAWRPVGKPTESPLDR
jgi:hypothetical protein